MVRSIAEAVAEYESILREWVALNRRFETPGADPHHGTTRANSLAKKLAALADSLAGEHVFRERLTVLLDDPDAQVRLDAAIHALAWAPGRAEDVLVEIEQLPGLVSLGAKCTLKRYRESPQTTGAPVPKVAAGAPSSAVGPELERPSDDVWAFHGAAMNGGFLLAFETQGHLTERVSDAFRQMGLTDVAEAIASAVRLFPGGRVPADRVTRTRLIDSVIDSELLEELGDLYTELIPSDEFLESRVELLAAVVANDA